MNKKNNEVKSQKAGKETDKKRNRQEKQQQEQKYVGSQNEREKGNKKEGTEEKKQPKAKKEQAHRRSSLERGPRVVVPPNGGWGWVVVIAAFYCTLVADGIQFTFGIFLKPIADSLEENHSTVAVAGALMFGFHLFVGPICAGLSRVYGIRLVTISGSLLCAFGVGITYWTESVWYLYFTYGIVGGAGLGFVYMNCMVITSEYFTSLLPIAIGIVSCGTGCGTLIFAGVGNYMLGIASWKASFLIQAALSGSMALVAITFKPLNPVRMRLDGVPPQQNQTEPSKEVIYIKRHLSYLNAASKLSMLTVPWEDLVEKTVVSDIKRTRGRTGYCCRCYKKREKQALDVIHLSEVKLTPAAPSRRVFLETKPESDVELTSHKTLFTQVEFDNTPEKKWEPIKRTIKAIADCHLLTSVAFTIFTVNGAVQLGALLVVFIYEKDRCGELGIGSDMSVYFVMCLGGSNMFWRLVMGGLATIPKVNLDALSISGIVIGGVATMCSGYSSEIWYHFMFCFLFGMATASLAVFRVIYLVELVGVHRVSNAIGIGLLFMGIACVIFPPLFGLAMEVTESYEIIFFCAGILLIVSGLSQIGLRKLRKREMEKETAKMLKSKENVPLETKSEEKITQEI